MVNNAAEISLKWGVDMEGWNSCSLLNVDLRQKRSKIEIFL